MNKLLMVTIFSCATLASCKKSTMQTAVIYSKNITGKWNYSQGYYSDGSALIYEPTSYLHQWVIFNNDSSFSSNEPTFEGFNSYSIQDSFRIKFISQLQHESLYFYHIDSLKNTLSLSNADFICIEGCGDIFKK
jgi:hypothetical protein